VPALWWFEIRNSATMGVRRKLVDRLEVATFLKRLELMVIEIVDLPNSNVVFDLALRHNLTFYDAAYLELAQRESIALATLDHALVRAATSEGVALIAA
jgi:predicted nucleic acid-binding protein